MSKPSLRQVVITLLILVLLSQFVTLGALYRVVHSNRNFRTYATRQLSNFADQQARAVNVGGETHVAVVPSDNAVYIPEFRLKLPMNLTTEQFVYSLRSSDKDGSLTTPIEADVSTAALASYPLPAQPISCASSVRIKLEAKPNPYNPHETVAASVKLADGRTLQVYVFHEDSCKFAFQITGTDPDAQAAEFKDATSF